MPRKTKIIATLGPASSGLDTIRDMVGAGMDAAMLNFSHGDYTSHSQFVDRVRAAAAGHDRAVAIIQDIQGPRIRAGTFPDGSVELQTGDEMDLVVDRGEPAASGEIPILMLDTAIVVKPGDRVLLDDGLIRLEVIGVDGAKARARVVEGGALHDHKGAVLPDSDLELPPVTDKDRRDLEFGAEAGVDLVAASFVASGDDVRLVKKLAGDIPIIAKIERRIAYEALDDILEVAAGAMVARGDLGVELSIQKLPVVQKDIIRKTNASGHISITATEMLESMVHSPRPTRAEVADVANALIDGTDAIMLSAETAIGRDPV
ncbi:MAG: pyruvate kinase, partial [Acidimicrobiia bacterium]